MIFEKCNYYKQIIRITIFLSSLHTEEFNRTPKKRTGMESVQATYIGTKEFNRTPQKCTGMESV